MCRWHVYGVISVCISFWWLSGCSGGSCINPNPNYDATVTGSQPCLDSAATPVSSGSAGSPEEGTEGGKCYGNNTCNSSLTCAGGYCVPLDNATTSSDRIGNGGNGSNSTIPNDGNGGNSTIPAGDQQTGPQRPGADATSGEPDEPSEGLSVTDASMASVDTPPDTSSSQNYEDVSWYEEDAGWDEESPIDATWSSEPDSSTYEDWDSSYGDDDWSWEQDTEDWGREEDTENWSREEDAGDWGWEEDAGDWGWEEDASFSEDPDSSPDP